MKTLAEALKELALFELERAFVDRGTFVVVFGAMSFEGHCTDEFDLGEDYFWMRGKFISPRIKDELALAIRYGSVIAFSEKYRMDHRA